MHKPNVEGVRKTVAQLPGEGEGISGRSQLDQVTAAQNDLCSQTYLPVRMGGYWVRLKSGSDGSEFGYGMYF